MSLLNLGLKLTILGGAKPRLLVNNLGTSSDSDQAQIHTGFLNLENSLEERDFK